MSDVDNHRFSLSAKVARAAVLQECWWITVVYEPQADQDKVEFLKELLHFRNSAAGPRMLALW